VVSTTRHGYEGGVEVSALPTLEVISAKNEQDVCLR